MYIARIRSSKWLKFVGGRKKYKQNSWGKESIWGAHADAYDSCIFVAGLNWQFSVCRSFRTLGKDGSAPTENKKA